MSGKSSIRQWTQAINPFPLLGDVLAGSAARAVGPFPLASRRLSKALEVYCDTFNLLSPSAPLYAPAMGHCVESHSRISSAIALVSSLNPAGMGFSRWRGLNPMSCCLISRSRARKPFKVSGSSGEPQETTVPVASLPCCRRMELISSAMSLSF